MAGALGWYWYLSDHLEGRQQLRATLNVADRAGDITPAARGRTLQAMAMVERPGACVVHPSPVCAQAARESVALFEAAGEPAAAALSRLLTAVEGAAGDAPESSLAAMATRYGFSAGQGLASLGRGHLARRAGDGAAAREHFRQAISLCEQVGSSLLTATALASLGYLEESLGELERADGAHRQVLALGGATFTAMGMEGLAGVAVARGNAMRAAELLGHAAELRDRHQVRPTPLERPDIQRITRLIRHRLDPEAFDAAFNHGRRTTLDELRSVP